MQSQERSEQLQDGEGAGEDLNSDLKPYDHVDGVGEDVAAGGLLKNYRLDISFDRDRITNLDNRSGMSAHAEAGRQGGP